MKPADELVQLSDPGEVGRAEHNRGDRVIVRISNFFAWLFPFLMLAICAQVVLRGAGMNQAWLDDFQWWVYGAAVLTGIGYAVTTGSHVRVDIFFDNYPREKQTRIEIFGLAWLFLPFILLSWDITVHYAISSYIADEGSDSPNGLHNLWMLKVFMNVSFLFIAVACWAAYVRFLKRLTRPVLWKQLLYALPSTMFALNLVAFYAIWWALRLTTPAEVSDRDLGRHWIFGHVELGSEEIKYTILITVALTVLVIGAARLMDRGSKAEG